MPKQDHMMRTRLKKVQRLLGVNRIDEARKLAERLCAQPGADATAWALLAEIYGRTGRLADRVGCLQRVVALQPADSTAWRSLGDACLQQGMPERAAECYRRAAESSPADPRLLTNYAAILMGLNRYSEAEPLLKTAVNLDPELPEPYTNLGSCLRAQGRIDEALHCYREGLQRVVQAPVLYSNYLLARHYQAKQDPQSSLDAHREWARRHTQNAGVDRECNRSVQDAGRRLRIGYVSPDFRVHSVAYFLAPLFSNHDRDAFEISCYADVHRPDAMTQSLKGMVDHWRDTVRFGEADLERLIRSDRIDILVDLAGHTAGNRLGVFARRPAPVQITWLGYPDTTGLDAMDFRLSDAHADPAGFDCHYSEKLLRLRDCFVCYSPPDGAPVPSSSPVEKNDFVTFGSFNNLSKINDAVVELWADILRQAPGTRLVIKNPGLTDSAVRKAYLSRFGLHGIDAGRVDLLGLSPTTREHLAAYRLIDIGLDTFPYNGTTTTCEALWMGVPVLTLTGKTHAGCVGSSLLTAAGLEEWITSAPDEYVKHAVSLAGAPRLLAALRASLRERTRASVLCDGRRFASNMEAAYRAAWEICCNG